MTKAQTLLAQLDGIVQQLKVELGSPGPVITSTITTAAELAAACAAGGTYTIASGDYMGNFKVTKPLTLTGPGSAVLHPSDPLQPTLTVLASDVMIDGITVWNGAKDRECIVVGNPTATSASAQPSNVMLRKMGVVAGTAGGHRGIALHGMNLTIDTCRVVGFWENGRDAQAVWINNGPGPYAVIDSYLEGSGENIMVGGDTIAIPNCVPADITIRGNTLFKPQTWRTNGALVKNSLELKAARRVLIENNTIDGCWRGGQSGTPFMLTTRNQYGDNPWVIVDEVTIRGNTVVNCPEGFAVNILGMDNNYPSQQTQTVTIEHNLFRDVRGGFLIGNGVTKALTIRNNTLPAVKGTFLDFSDTRPTPVPTKLIFVDNVVASGEYGIHSSDYAVGTPTLVGWAPGFTFTGNVIEQSAARTIPYPVGNIVLTPGTLAAQLDPKTLKLLTGTAGY